MSHTRIQLGSQVQGVLPRLHGGTGNESGNATDRVLIPVVNDFGSSLTIGGLVRRTAAAGYLQTNTSAGQQIFGVVAGRYSPTTGLFEAVNPAANETAAICIAGRTIVKTASLAARADYLRASGTAGHADPSAAPNTGTFGIVVSAIDSSTCLAIISLDLGVGSIAAPVSADYLVGTANAGLSGEIVAGTSPGGELGGTWGSPTVDATHSGSTHSAATDTHIADSSDAHDASAISILDSGGYYTGTDVEAALQEISARNAVGPILIADDHSTPLVFDDLLQTEAGDDLLYLDP